MNSIRFWPAVVRLHGTPCFTTPAPTWCHKVLAAAGTDSVGPLASAELYDEATDVWTLTAPLTRREASTPEPS